MTTYFFDTSALKYRYIDSPVSARIRRVISNQEHVIYVSELTIVELASGFADACRNNNWGYERFDAMYREFFKDVERNRITVQRVTQRELEKAIYLLRFGRAIMRRGLKSADAIIAETCRELCYQSGKSVIFYLCDEKLFKILSAIDAYKSIVNLRFVKTI